MYPKSYDVFTNEVLTVPVSRGVLADALNAAGAIASVDTPPQYGKLTLNPDGSFSYRPNSGYQGYDVFVFRGSNSYSQSSPKATIRVVPAQRCEIGLLYADNLRVTS